MHKIGDSKPGGTATKPWVGFVPSFRVHLMEPDFLLTACRFPSRVDTNSKLSGRETVVALQNPCTKEIITME